MKKLILGPLGWNQHIFQLVDTKEIDYIIYFHQQPIETVSQVHELLSTDKFIIYTFSYGGLFLEYMLTTYPQLVANIEYVYYFDSLTPIPDVSLSLLTVNRITEFKDIDQLLSMYFEEDNPDQHSLVLEQFTLQDGIYSHFMSNELMFDYIQLTKDIQSPTTLSFPASIYSSTPLSTTLGEIIEIDSGQHLMMVECPQLVSQSFLHEKR